MLTNNFGGKLFHIFVFFHLINLAPNIMVCQYDQWVLSQQSATGMSAARGVVLAWRIGT